MNRDVKKSMGYIFISYSKDDQKVARHIKIQLEAVGFTVWMDESHPPLDPAIWEVIEGNIVTSAAVLLIMSPESQQSYRVMSEVQTAIQRDKPIFPVLLDGEPWPLSEGLAHVRITRAKPDLPPQMVSDLMNVAPLGNPDPPPPFLVGEDTGAALSEEESQRRLSIPVAIATVIFLVVSVSFLLLFDTITNGTTDDSTATTSSAISGQLSHTPTQEPPTVTTETATQATQASSIRPSRTPSHAPSRTSTPATLSVTPSFTASPRPSRTPSPTPSQTHTPVPPSATPSSTASRTPSPTPSRTFTPITPSSTPSPTKTNTPTATPTSLPTCPSACPPTTTSTPVRIAVPAEEIPHEWYAGTTLYILDVTGLSRVAGQPPVRTAQFQKGDRVTVGLGHVAPGTRREWYLVPATQERWWFITEFGGGWLPENVLVERPPK